MWRTLMALKALIALLLRQHQMWKRHSVDKRDYALLSTFLGSHLWKGHQADEG
jgi:hypothetical protein